MTRDVHGNPYCEYVYLELKMIWYWWCFDNLYDVSCIKDLKLALRSLLLMNCWVQECMGLGYNWR
jgi:hypothetical protein